MKLSTRARYGLRLMMSLARHKGEGPRYLKDIAREEGISEKYLGQIVILLRARGLVTSYRGARGGYILSRPASSISLREIIEPLEGDFGLVECVNNASLCERSSSCGARRLWCGLSGILLEFLDSLTLEDVAAFHLFGPQPSQ